MTDYQPDETADAEQTAPPEDLSSPVEPVDVVGAAAADAADDSVEDPGLGAAGPVTADEPPAPESEATEPTGVDTPGPAADDRSDSADGPAEDEGADALARFRESLHSQPGDWYVVHTYSGMENRVKTNLENRTSSLNMEEFIYEIRVPQEEVPEIKNGQRRMVRRTVLPGYVLVRMELTDESWSAVRHTPSVTGFVGHSHQPVPLGLDEVEAMLAPAIVQQTAAPSRPAQQPVAVSDFCAGDSVMVVDGPFATLHATITEINVDAARIKALVEIFGRETPVDLSFNQIERS
ncbi:MAG: transcription termination/antitermination protein NusG [Sciscionella sp.]